MKTITAYFFRSLLVTFFCIWIIGCNAAFSKKVEFKKGEEDIVNTVKLTYDFEEVNVLSTSEGDGKKFLIINLVNGKNLPNDSTLNAMGAKYATAINSAIQNPNEFDVVKVAYISKTSGGITKSSSSKVFEYNRIK